MKDHIKINIYDDSSDLHYRRALECPTTLTISKRKIVELMLPKHKRTITEVDRVIDALERLVQ